jgi:hypothetical protein
MTHKDFIDLLRDPAMQSILGILGIVLTVILTIQQQQRKKIACRVVSIIPLLNEQAQNSLKGRLTINFDNSPKENIYIATIRLYNSGNIPIPEADFSGNPIIDMGVKILGVDVIETYPRGIRFSINKKIGNEHEIEIQRVLLNPNNAVLIKAVLEDMPNPKQIDFYAHIAGLNKCELVLPEDFEQSLFLQRKRSSQYFLFGSTLICLGIAGYLFALNLQLLAIIIGLLPIIFIVLRQYSPKK